MRVLFINRDPDAWIGGDAIQVEQTRQALQEIGVDVKFSYDPNSDVRQFDVVHAFHINYGWTDRIARQCERFGVPLVVSAIYFPEEHQVGKGRMAEILSSAASVIALSEPEAAEIRENLNLPDLKIVVVPNGVDTKRFHKTGILGQDALGQGVIAVGPLVPAKGLLRVAEACQALGIPFTAVGKSSDDPYAQAVIAKATAHYEGLSQNEMAELYRAHAVMVCSSDTERQSLSVLEAAACGVHLVDSQFNRGSGLLPSSAVVNPKDPRALHDAIQAQLLKRGFNPDVVPSWNDVANLLNPIYTRAIRRPFKAPTQRARPLVSVGMPVYNHAQFVGEAIDSILNQSVSDFELIIVDNASTDGSADVVRQRASVDPRIRVITLPENLGPTESANQAWKTARGEFLAVMHSDDISLPHRLHMQVQFLRANPEVGLCGSAIVNFGQGQPEILEQVPTDPEHIRSRMLFRNSILFPTVMARRELIFTHELWFDPTYTPVFDYELWMRCMEKFPIANLAEPLLRYRRHSGQGSSYDRNPVVDQSRRVQREWLEKWFGAMSPDETFAWEKLGTLMPLTHEELLIAEPLMMRMLEQNQREQRFNVEYFNDACHEIWNIVMAKSRPDLGATVAAPDRPPVSLVVLTYNSMTTIAACFESALRTMGPHDELIAVDNASRDGTGDWLLTQEAKDRRIKVILNKQNLGFSLGTNVGLKKAKGELLVMLNPDTVVTTGWLDRMAAFFAAPDMAAVGPTSDMVAGYQKVQFHVPPGTQGNFDNEGVARLLAQANPGKGQETKLLIGFCMMVRRSVMEKLGYLDENLFLGNDDLELSWRLRQSGYRIAIAADAFVHHECQVSFSSEPTEKVKRLVQESTDALARKLEGHYGKSKVPSSMELWDMDWFKPSFELWPDTVAAA